MNMSNGIPNNCIDHPEVEWVTVKLPIYTGQVSDSEPGYLEDRLTVRLLAIDERIGLNRVFEGYKRIYPGPASSASRSQVARWVFSLVAKAFQTTPAPQKSKQKRS